jgi:hypothetical protein
MCVHLLLVVPHRRLCHRAHVALVRLCGVGVVGRQDGRSGAHDGADGIVHGLALGLPYRRLQRGALGREGRGGLGQGDRGVLLEVVVVVGGCADDGTRLGGGVSRDEKKRSTCRTWPSLARSISGWLGGSTSLVEPMTGQRSATEEQEGRWVDWHTWAGGSGGHVDVGSGLWRVSIPCAAGRRCVLRVASLCCVVS